MTSELIAVIVLGSLQALAVLFMFLEIKTTREAYLEGRILVSLRPRGSTGFVTLRVENVGLGPINEVRLTFPKGFPAKPNRETIIDLAEHIPQELGTFGPREFREWNIGFFADLLNSPVPDKIPYVLEYQIPRMLGSKLSKLLHFLPLPAFITGKQRVVGELRFSGYRGVLLNPYTNLEDLVREIKRMQKTIQSLIAKLPTN